MTSTTSDHAASTNGNGSVNPCLIVIFGASGDLTKRKLIPALYDLYAGNQLPEQFSVLGVSRTEFSDDAFRDRLHEWVRKNAADYNDDCWSRFSQRLHYHAADPTAHADYPGLKARVAELAKEHQIGENVLFYLALAPQLYDDVIVNLGVHSMVTEGKAWCSINRFSRPWQRIIVEKPFGNDPASAGHLNRVLGRVFEEESIYRIDHYLGKETVQNLMVFRFANTIFEPIWNRQFIECIQVTAAETVGVEGRGGYYDSPGGGAMRDMIQSHLVQVMALVAMEPPVTTRADAIRLEKSKVLSAVRAIKADEVERVAVRGQYGPGTFDGKPVSGFRQEQGVGAESQTDTYAAVQLYIDTWRWGGVPFYLRSGKRMPRKLTQIVICFRPTPLSLFPEQSRGTGLPPANQIIINVQPDEGIRIRFQGKVPGSGMKIRDVVMDFDYVKQFNAEPPEAYATLLLDCMRGDQTLFKHRDEVESAWRIVQPVLDFWQDNPQNDLPNYAAGSWGPPAADHMMGQEGHNWHNPE